MESQVEDSGRGHLLVDRTSDLDAPVVEEPAYAVAGESASGEFHCAGCSYGISVKSLLPVCPMCGGDEWAEPVRAGLARPFG